MGTFQTLEEAREYFRMDRFATENGAVIEEIGENWSICSMEIQERHLNAAGGLMGGVTFMLADFAFAVASNNAHSLTVAQQASISFLNSCKGTRLTAKAKCRKDGKSTCVYTVDVSDDSGRDIALFIGTGYKL